MCLNYKNFYSVNTSHIEIYLLNYSILYSVQYMQYCTVTYFNNSTIIDVDCNIFNKLLLPSSGY